MMAGTHLAEAISSFRGEKMTKSVMAQEIKAEGYQEKRWQRELTAWWERKIHYAGQLP